jgi:hypothetical protein
VTRPHRLARDLSCGPSACVSAPRSASSNLGLASKSSRLELVSGAAGLTSRLRGALPTASPPCLQAPPGLLACLLTSDPAPKSVARARPAHRRARLELQRTATSRPSRFLPSRLAARISLSKMLAFQTSRPSGEGPSAAARRSTRQHSSPPPPVPADLGSAAPTDVDAPRSASVVRGLEPEATPVVSAISRSSEALRRATLPASSSRRVPGEPVIDPRPDFSLPKKASARLGDDSVPASGWSGHHARQ